MAGDEEEDPRESSYNSVDDDDAAELVVSEFSDARTTKLWDNPYLVRLVLTASFTAATLGYDVGIMAAAIQPIESHLQINGVQKEVAMGSLNFMAAFGSWFGGTIADQYGRKYTVQVCGIIFVIGTLCMCLAPSYGWLLIGRIVTGIGVGVSFVVAPTYISEVAPSDMRGSLNTVFDISINIGILLGYVLGFLIQLCNFLDEHVKWRIMLGLGIILPIFVLYFVQTLDESPRWLMLQQRSDEARHVLDQLGEPNIDATITAIQTELEETNAYANEEHHCTVSSGQRTGIFLGFWQQVTGTEAVLYYSADFLKNAGLQSPVQRLGGNCFVGICKLVPELIAMRYVDTLGRKVFMIVSAVSLAVCTGLLSCAFYLNWSPLIVVLLLCGIMASFSVGLGPFTFLVVSENLELSERASGMMKAAAVNRCTSGIVALTTVSLSESLGDGGFFAIYCVIGLLSLFFYVSLPETSGQSLEELSARRRRGDHRRVPSQESVELIPDRLT